MTWRKDYRDSLRDRFVQMAEQSMEKQTKGKANHQQGRSRSMSQGSPARLLSLVDESLPIGSPLSPCQRSPRVRRVSLPSDIPEYQQITSPRAVDVSSPSRRGRVRSSTVISKTQQPVKRKFASLPSDALTGFIDYVSPMTSGRSARKTSRSRSRTSSQDMTIGKTPLSESIRTDICDEFSVPPFVTIIKRSSVSTRLSVSTKGSIDSRRMSSTPENCDLSSKVTRQEPVINYYQQISSNERVLSSSEILAVNQAFSLPPRDCELASIIGVFNIIIATIINPNVDYSSICCCLVVATILYKAVQQRFDGVSDLGHVVYHLPTTVNHSQASITPDLRRLPIVRCGNRMFGSDGAHSDITDASKSVANIAFDYHERHHAVLVLILAPPNGMVTDPEDGLHNEAMQLILREVSELSPTLVPSSIVSRQSILERKATIKRSKSFLLNDTVRLDQSMNTTKRPWEHSCESGKLYRYSSKFQPLSVISHCERMIDQESHFLLTNQQNNFCIVSLSGSTEVSESRSAVLLSVQQLRQGKGASQAAFVDPVSLQVASCLQKKKKKDCEGSHRSIKVITLSLIPIDDRASRIVFRQLTSYVGVREYRPLASLYFAAKLALLVKKLTSSRRHILGTIIKDCDPYHVSGGKSIEFSVGLIYRSGYPLRRRVPYYATAYLHRKSKRRKSEVVGAFMTGNNRKWIEDGRCTFKDLSVTGPAGEYCILVVFNIFFLDDAGVPSIQLPTVVETAEFTLLQDNASLLAMTGFAEGVQASSLKLSVGFSEQYSEVPSAMAFTICSRLTRMIIPVSGFVEVYIFPENHINPSDPVAETSFVIVKTIPRKPTKKVLSPRPVASSVGQSYPSPKKGMWDRVRPNVGRRAACTKIPRNPIHSIRIVNGQGSCTVVFPHSGRWTVRGVLFFAGYTARIGIHSTCSIRMHPAEERRLLVVAEAKRRLTVAAIESSSLLTDVVAPLDVSCLFSWKQFLYRFELTKKVCAILLSIVEEEERIYIYFMDRLGRRWIMEELRVWTSTHKPWKGLTLLTRLNTADTTPDRVHHIRMNEKFTVTVSLAIPSHGGWRELTPYAGDAVLLQLVEDLPDGDEEDDTVGSITQIHLKYKNKTPFMPFSVPRRLKNGKTKPPDSSTLTKAKARITKAGTCRLRVVYEMSSRVTISHVTGPVVVSHVPETVCIRFSRHVFHSEEVNLVYISVLDSRGEPCHALEGYFDLSLEFQNPAKLHGNKWEELMIPPPHNKIDVNHNNKETNVVFPKNYFLLFQTGTYRMRAKYEPQAFRSRKSAWHELTSATSSRLRSFRSQPFIGEDESCLTTFGSLSRFCSLDDNYNSFSVETLQNRSSVSEEVVSEMEALRNPRRGAIRVAGKSDIPTVADVCGVSKPFRIVSKTIPLWNNNLSANLSLLSLYEIDKLLQGNDLKQPRPIRMFFLSSLPSSIPSKNKEQVHLLDVSVQLSSPEFIPHNPVLWIGVWTTDSDMPAIVSPARYSLDDQNIVSTTLVIPLPLNNSIIVEVSYQLGDGSFLVLTSERIAVK